MKALIFFAALFIFCLFGCENCTDSNGGSSLKIDRIELSATNFGPNGDTYATAIITGADQESLTFAWSVSIGTLYDPDKNPSHWFFGNNTGQAKISCVITDNKAVVEDSLIIIISSN